MLITGRILRVVLAAALLFSAFPTSAKDDRVRREVLLTEKAIAGAQINNDTAAMERLLARDYTFTIPDGTVITRERFLSDMKTWWHPELVENTDQSVRQVGEVVIVLGKARYRWKGKNGVEEAREQYTDTYVRIHGVWKRASSHSSCLAGRCS
jgi:hypothetical protein